MDGFEKRRQRKSAAALQRCAAVAAEEYPHAQKALAQAETRIQELRARMEAIHGAADGLSGTAIEDAQKSLTDLKRQLDRVVTQQLTATADGLAKKKKRLEKFTVTLFGRTMAGKSTIREALTHGDGSTIGKGAQRTTRDIQEYEWKHLRIIDTPGIGAYEGNADSELAQSVVDESDVLLFLVSSDSIQESSFQGMRALRDQNKPILFVLNVKHDLTKPVHRRKFLKDSSSIMGKEAIRGHGSRIRTLASGKLGIRKPRLVPIHAQAAFLATRPKYASQRVALHRASGIEDLREELVDEVLKRGPIRRLQTLLDGTIVKLMDLEEQLQQEAKDLKHGARYLKDKFAKLNTWLDGYIGTVNKRIESRASELLRPLHFSVSSFVDENIERPDVKTRWRDKVEAVEIEGWMKSVQQQLRDEVLGHLQEFNREVGVESQLLDRIATKGLDRIATEGPEQYDPRDVKRTLKRISSASVLFAIAAGNSWNPLGWIAGAVAVGSFGLSYFFEDREEKLQRGKAKAAKQLRSQLNRIEQRIADEVKGWFDNNITKSLVQGLREQTSQLYRSMFDLSRALGKAASSCADVQAELNLRLLRRCGQFVRAEVAEGTISTIAREPGLGTKFIYTNGPPTLPSFCRKVGRALGERLDAVEWKGGAYWKMIAAALRPARVDPEKVEETNVGTHKTLVQIPTNQMGRAIGKRGSNLRLASRLMKTQIQLQKE